MKKLFLWQLGALTFIAVFGTLFHFLYHWTGILAFAPVCAVNESTWEHMKIFFVPAFLFTIIQSFFLGKEYENFWYIKLLGTLIGVLLIPVLYYTINGAFGSSPDWLNITFFFLSAFIACFVEYWLFNRDFLRLAPPVYAIIVFIILCFTFFFFTFFPPNIPLFQDPVTGFYGIKP